MRCAGRVGSMCGPAENGGALALVRDGDIIELDVAGRRLELMVSDAELAARRAGLPLAFWA